MILCFLLFFVAVLYCLFASYSLSWALLVGLLLFSLLGLRRGIDAKTLWSMAWSKGRSSLIVTPVFLMIGIVTALWRSAGTISFFLYYGLRSISPSWFVLTAFVLSAALSYALGTSFGVTGTAGVVLITLARSGGVDLAVTAGAILSGAYFGDRCSPMSSCAALVAACTGTDLYSNVRRMLKTAALPTALTLIFFAALSVWNPITGVDTGILSSLYQNFDLRWPALIPALLILVLPLLHVPILHSMTLSAVAAFLLSVSAQQLPVMDAVKTALSGYIPVQAELVSILSGGGLISMLSTSLLVFLTSLYAGILEGLGAFSGLQHQADQLAEKIGLFPAAIAASTLSAMVFCNQSVTIVMCEQLLSESYRKHGADRQTLAIDIANSGVTIAGLVPWNIAISVPLAMLGVGAEALPWCALLYLIPLCYLPTRRFFTQSSPSVLNHERI